MNRTDIINYYLSTKKEPTFYLEIGVQNPDANFNKIKATNKYGVDPTPFGPCKYIMTSDKFFAMNSIKYDAIFVKQIDHYGTTTKLEGCSWGNYSYFRQMLESKWSGKMTVQTT